MKMFTPSRGVEGCVFAGHTILSLSHCGRLHKVVHLLQNLLEYFMNHILFRDSVRDSKKFEINGSILFRPDIQTA